MNICMIGHGMMGVWHSEALKATPATLHTIVGRRDEPTSAFAARYGYHNWTTDLAKALADPEIDIVIVASPSEQHVAHAISSIEAGKHTLVEIPIAMSLAGTERVLEAAARSQQIHGMVHPMRIRTESAALKGRIERGEEKVHLVEGRFFIHRLENVGATGYRRSWTDNALWHHAAHLVDFGCWMLGDDLTNVAGWMAPIDPRTGVPMTTHIRAERADGALLSCLLTYYGREATNQTLVVTDKGSYRIDIRTAHLTTGERTTPIEPEAQNLARLTRNFVDAVHEGRQPAIPIASARPAMTILEEVQRQWDERHGPSLLPGRPDGA